ncbi:class II glutamine amidotransferase [Candidatus Woesearchaeota archaeon]|nr:class II glutamine amidotransferase [Candidatus Woesearchaeota archaeon]
MLIGVGDVQINLLLDSAIKMAKDENLTHELNEDLGPGSWMHSDGWGIAYLDGTTWVVEKSTKAIFHDPKVDQLRNIKTNLAIIHVRKKMGSKTHYKNTHPFKFKRKDLGDYAFCHNGYIEEEIEYCPSFSPKGETDSEQLFYAILSKIQEKKPVESMRETLERYNKCTGTNVILATKETSFIGTRDNKFPRYYNMKIAKTDNFILVSSEVLSEFKDLEWQNIELGDIISINNETLTFQVDKKPIISIDE